MEFLKISHFPSSSRGSLQTEYIIDDDHCVVVENTCGAFCFFSCYVNCFIIMDSTIAQFIYTHTYNHFRFDSFGFNIGVCWVGFDALKPTTCAVDLGFPIAVIVWATHFLYVYSADGSSDRRDATH